MMGRILGHWQLAWAVHGQTYASFESTGAPATACARPLSSSRSGLRSRPACLPPATMWCRTVRACVVKAVIRAGTEPTAPRSAAEQMMMKSTPARSSTFPTTARIAGSYCSITATGRFTDNGYVDCVQAAYQSGIGSPKQWSAARVKVISTGFRDH